MTPEQKAQRLEHYADQSEHMEQYYRDGGDTVEADTHEADAALLRECAAMWRERGAVRWETNGVWTAQYKGFTLRIIPMLKSAVWEAWQTDSFQYATSNNHCNTVSAAQAAAVAWVDAQEGKP